MTVLGRGLIFQPVLASLPYTQTCAYNSDTVSTLQNITDITDFPSTLKIKIKTYKKSHDTTDCFDMALKLSTLQAKNDKRQNQMRNITKST